MIGRMIATIINLSIITLIIFIIVFYFLHQTIKEEVNELNYNVMEVASTTGVFSQELYTYLSDNVNKYGNYLIKIKLEQKIKPGVYDTFFDVGEIIDKRLQIGDRLTLYLEDRDPTLFGRFINAAFMGYAPEEYIDIRIKSVKKAVIAKRAKDLVKGYDVIVDIKHRSADDAVAVWVATKSSPNGKYYGAAAHQDVPVSNPDYGDSRDEAETTGENYIFVNGDFIKQMEYCPSTGLAKLIRYRQQ